MFGETIKSLEKQIKATTDTINKTKHMIKNIGISNSSKWIKIDDYLQKYDEENRSSLEDAMYNFYEVSKATIEELEHSLLILELAYERTIRDIKVKPDDLYNYLIGFLSKVTGARWQVLIRRTNEGRTPVLFHLPDLAIDWQEVESLSVMRSCDNSCGVDIRSDSLLILSDIKTDNEGYIQYSNLKETLCFNIFDSIMNRLFDYLYDSEGVLPDNVEIESIYEECEKLSEITDNTFIKGIKSLIGLQEFYLNNSNPRFEEEKIAIVYKLQKRIKQNKGIVV